MARSETGLAANNWENEAAKEQIIIEARDSAIEALIGGDVREFNSWRMRHSWIPVDLRNRNLEGARVSGALLYRCEMRGAVLRGADLRGAIFAETDASLVDFANSNLSDSRWQSVDLSAANFRNAKLCRARMSLCRCSGAILQGADLTDLQCELPCDFRFAVLDSGSARLELSSMTRLSLDGNARLN